MIDYMIWLFTVTYIGCIQKLYSKYCPHIFMFYQIIVSLTLLSRPTVVAEY
jgi:hypothetical protein